MRVFIILLLIVSVFQLKAQKKEKFDFAQTYFGASSGLLTGSNNLHSYQRLSIGGMHFWGKADFYVSFAVAQQNLGDGYNFTEGVQTGGRWVPWGLKRRSLSPFIGGHWQTPSLFGDNIPQLEKNAFSLEFGIYYFNKKDWTIELGARFNPMNQWAIPYSNQRPRSANWAFEVGIKKLFEFTAGNNVKWAQKTTESMKENKHHSTFGLAVGMSSAIALAPISWLKKEGFEPGTAAVYSMPEYGISYYWGEKEMVFRLAYRAPSRNVVNDNFSYQLKDRRLSVEAFKFLFDYQGFMPFFGLGFNHSFYNINFSSSSAENFKESGSNNSVGIVFGWDIRPTQAQWFILRTGLKYQPRLGLNEFAKSKLSQDLEFNFIQMVIYPQRMRYYFK